MREHRPVFTAPGPAAKARMYAAAGRAPGPAARARPGIRPFSWRTYVDPEALCEAPGGPGCRGLAAASLRRRWPRPECHWCRGSERYIPTKNKISDIDNALSRDVSVIGGARLTFWGTGVLGFEATGGYAPAKIANETINETGNTNLLAASGRLLLALSPVTNRVGVYLGAGPALLARGQDPFDSE